MFNSIKTWFLSNFVLIAIVVASCLAFALAGVGYLYLNKIEDFAVVSEKNGQLVIQIEQVNAQIEEERLRHRTLEAAQKQAYDDFIGAQNTLLLAKNDKAKKTQAVKDPLAYQKEVQKALTDYQNKMNCISGNTVACTRN